MVFLENCIQNMQKHAWSGSFVQNLCISIAIITVIVSPFAYIQDLNPVWQKRFKTEENHIIKCINIKHNLT